MFVLLVIKEKRVFATQLFRKVFDEYHRNMRLTVIKKEGDLRLIKFYNSLGFVYRSETNTFYELVKKETSYLDLDLIKIGPEEKISMYMIEQHIKKDFKRTTLPVLYYMDPLKGKIALHVMKILGRGSAGFVYLYSNETGSIKITVKQFFNNKKMDRNFEIESNISRRLRADKKVDCSIINSRALENKNNKIILMDYLPGIIPNEINFKQSLQILRELTKILSCLFDKGFIMTDIAVDNMLYNFKKF